MTTVRQILDDKGHDVWSVGPEAMVLDAIRLMADKDVGALMVLEDGRPVGIFTERRYAREVFLQGRASPNTKISDVMETQVVCAQLRQTVEECMALMTDKKIRHLPVMDDNRLVGMISIGDLVKNKIADQKFEIEQLEQYIRSP